MTLDKGYGRIPNSLNMNKQLILPLSLAFVASIAISSSTSAAGRCEIIYGGGEVCPPSLNLTIDKKVQTPNKGSTFVDNLSVNDQRFAPNSPVTFQIEVKNTGDKKIDKIEVTDEFPQHLTFETGVGNYDAEKRVLSFTVTNLEPGKNAVYTIVARTAKSENLPSDTPVTCVVNRVKAIANSQGIVTDASQLCIEKSITPDAPMIKPAPKAVTTPPTGPEALTLLALIPSGIIGTFLRKKSQLR